MITAQIISDHYKTNAGLSKPHFFMAKTIGIIKAEKKG